jgi:hypothetical protein
MKGKESMWASQDVNMNMNQRLLWMLERLCVNGSLADTGNHLWIKI